ncbi:hypothetical protein IEU95_07470 [Hoyosella rhizosphaerae]|uniref:Secreted protein n=1 Tax=Hoyosella rhizosphaerae TaxID=1755582 RepID=A0A916U4P3_9ACTN|nr:hypothetical protein [Hoyosella rhizosphaerae]MBN4926663.1 hypothetical protein [Hoyosella rhizosphaerae]GGC57431.1 hypothetical protein GCM10011410_07440 [Hoyosella rhizosphaerae]
MSSSISRKTLVVAAAAAGALALGAGAAAAEPLAFDPAPVATGGDLAIDVALTVPGGVGFPKDCDVTVTHQDFGIGMTQSGSDIGGEQLNFQFVPLIPGFYTVASDCVNTNPAQDPPNRWAHTQSNVEVTFSDDPQAIIDLLTELFS